METTNSQVFKKGNLLCSCWARKVLVRKFPPKINHFCVKNFYETKINRLTICCAHSFRRNMKLWIVKHNWKVLLGNYQTERSASSLIMRIINNKLQTSDVHAQHSLIMMSAESKSKVFYVKENSNSTIWKAAFCAGCKPEIAKWVKRNSAHLNQVLAETLRQMMWCNLKPIKRALN